MSCRPLCVILARGMVVLIRMECSRAPCSACLIDSCCSYDASSVEDIVASIAGATCPEDIRMCNAMRPDCCKLKVRVRKRSLHKTSAIVYGDGQESYLYLTPAPGLPTLSGSAYVLNTACSTSVANAEARSRNCVLSSSGRSYQLSNTRCRRVMSVLHL